MTSRIAALLALVAPALASVPRSVLFLFEDDGGFALSPYGEPVLPTPNLERLANCGTTFDRAFTSVSSCSPSRASMLSGLPTHQSGMYGLCQGVDHFSAISGVQSLPNLLNAGGVATGIIGKYHVWGSPGEGAAAFNFSWGNGGAGGCQTGASYACPSTDYNLVSRNVSYMREQAANFWRWAGGEPAFLYVGFGDSHRCGGAAGDFCELYGRDKQGASTIPGWTPFVADPANVSLPFWIQDTPAARLDYSHMLTAKGRMDTGVGMMLLALSRTPYANSTMIVSQLSASTFPPNSNFLTTHHFPHTRRRCTLQTMAPPLRAERQLFMRRAWGSRSSYPSRAPPRAAAPPWWLPS